VQFGESGSPSSILNISSSIWSNKEIFFLLGIFFSLSNEQNEKIEGRTEKIVMDILSYSV
jgi:hypothetical protein